MEKEIFIKNLKNQRKLKEKYEDALVDALQNLLGIVEQGEEELKNKELSVINEAFILLKETQLRVKSLVFMLDKIDEIERKEKTII